MVYGKNSMTSYTYIIHELEKRMEIIIQITRHIWENNPQLTELQEKTTRYIFENDPQLTEL